MSFCNFLSGDSNFSGTYRVVATNAAGSAHDKGYATVKKLPPEIDTGYIDG